MVKFLKFKGVAETGLAHLWVERHVPLMRGLAATISIPAAARAAVVSGIPREEPTTVRNEY
jgi:hypothetical protein